MPDRRSRCTGYSGPVTPARAAGRAAADLQVGVDELRPGVVGQHVDDDHLPPLLDIHQHVAELAEVLVDQVNTFGADLGG